MNSFDIYQSATRNGLQKELLECGGDRVSLFNILRRTRELDMTAKTDEPLKAVGLVSFIEELCLAADFYLLPTGKSIGLYGFDSDITVLLPVRRTERDFFFISSRLFKMNRRISVRLFESDGFAGLVFEAETPLPAKIFNSVKLLNLSLTVGSSGVTPILRFEKTKQTAEGCPVDFSLLLCDKMSELNKWYFDSE